MALTAHVQDSERQRSLAEGFSVHVSKPVDPGELIEIVRAVRSISDHRSAAASLLLKPVNSTRLSPGNIPHGGTSTTCIRVCA